jgi:nucleoside-diphosphate-sugar epimerase
MAKVFITGGAGFIGSYVVRQLLSLGHEVTVFDNFVRYVLPGPNDAGPDWSVVRLADLLDRVTIVRGNTADTDFVRRAVAASAPDRVIHMAAMPLATLSVVHPEEAFASIVTGTLNLLQACREQKNLARLVLISSSMIYGGFVTTPVSENAAPDPKDVYGGLKLCSEITTRAFGFMYRIPTTVVRPAAVYGPTDTNKRVLQQFLDRALAGGRLEVKGPEQRLDFTYVKDTAAGIVAATFAEKAAGQTFNISRGEGRSLLEAARIVQELVPGTELSIEERDVRFPERGALDVSRAKELLGYAPRFSLEEGLREYHDFLTGKAEPPRLDQRAPRH